MTEEVELPKQRFLDEQRALPLRPKDKRPLHRDWQREATNDPEQIAQWARQGSNIGGVTGEGAVAVDIDPRNGGSIQAAAALGIPLNNVVITEAAAITLGSRHLWEPKGERSLRESRFAEMDNSRYSLRRFTLLGASTNGFTEPDRHPFPTTYSTA